MLRVSFLAGISLILLLQQSADVESKHGWPKDDPNNGDKDTVIIYLKDQPEEDRKMWLKHMDEAMKLHNTAFETIKSEIIPKLYIKYVYGGKNMMALVYEKRFQDVDVIVEYLDQAGKFRFNFKNNKFECSLQFHLTKGEVTIAQPPDISGLCFPESARKLFKSKVFSSLLEFNKVIFDLIRKALRHIFKPKK